MENIEVGEWVRSKIGSIGKVTKIEDGKFLYEDKSLITFIGNVVKHSKNIIDLIEVGDILKIHFPVRNTIRKIYVDEYFEDSMILNGIINGNVILKSILTHEQYEQNCYKVERKKDERNKI